MKKKFTKKYIQSIIRTEDRTQIYKLYVQMNGKVENRDMLASSVQLFIEHYAPTKRIARRSRYIAYKYPDVDRFDDRFRKYDMFCRENAKHIAMEYFRYQISMPFDSHTKLPLMGYTHLYFASPYYGHRDYNKHPSLAIAGNERFCELICRVGERYFQRLKAEAEG